MSSILTNMSAMSAVQNLTATQHNLANVQNQISTGLKVASAKDNAAYWSIATSMRTTNTALAAVGDSLNLGASILSTASSALGNVVSVMQKMVADLTTARTASSTDLTKIGSDIQTLQSQLTSTINSASFNGVNLLAQPSSGPTYVEIATSVSGSGTSFAVNTLQINYSGNALTTSSSGGILDTANIGTTSKSILTYAVSSSSTSGDISTYLAAVSAALATVQTVASTLGAYQNNVEMQSSFVSSLEDSIKQGIGSLVDADMNQASTRLNALQTQQQLGIQALSIANQNSQMILKLFG